MDRNLKWELESTTHLPRADKNFEKLDLKC